MNSYEQKQEARKARLQERADKVRREAESTIGQAREMASVIPFGQPILVGHYSEKGDRNYRARIENKYRKGFSLLEYAQELEKRAENFGSNGISSDDPEAISKLQSKLEDLETLQELMKDANAALRKNNDDALKELGFDEDGIAQLRKTDYKGRWIGYPSYRLTNNNANIRRIKERISELERLASQPSIEKEVNGIRLYEEDNRVCFHFPGKPEESVRTMLKQWGFKWSPTRSAWVRMANANGRAAAKIVFEKL